MYPIDNLTSMNKIDKPLVGDRRIRKTESISTLASQYFQLVRLQKAAK